MLLLIAFYNGIIKILIVLSMNVGVHIFLTAYYCLNDKGCFVFSFVCVYVFVTFSSFARSYFIIGFWSVE
jgi:hypothetical protein